MTQSQQLADCYQNLFNHLAQEYDLSLTESELDEVIRLSLSTVEKINALAEDSIGNVCREMQKQQILDAFNQGYREGEHDANICCNPNTDIANSSDAADYWQRTYGTNEPKQNQ